MSAENCLFECLKEATLDKYYGNFMNKGFFNCESLAKMTMEDYSSLGIISMEDRVRLFKLVQIVKNVQSEGFVCQHNRSPIKHDNKKKNICNKIASNNNSSKKKKTGQIKVVKHPIQSNLSDRLQNKSNVTTKSNFGNTHNRPYNLKKDSPIFSNPRKSLNFSNMSEDDDEMKKNKHHSTSLSRKTISHKGNGTENIKEFVSDHDLNSKDISLSPNGRKKWANKQSINIAPIIATNSHTTSSTVIANKQSISEIAVSENNNHAYFPIRSRGDSKKPEIIPIERIYHSEQNYGYGLPMKSLKCTPHLKQSVSQLKIVVCARKRPLLKKEIKKGDVDIINVEMEKNPLLIIREPKLAIDLSRYVIEHVFNFDEIFGEDSTNQSIYLHCVKPLVEHAFKRGTATCFAFGQTGSGKTHTLLGSNRDPGLYLMAANDLFKMMTDNKNGLKLWLSYYEIYCGHLYDLLNRRRKIFIRENGQQEVCVAGLTETPIINIKILSEIVSYGNKARSIGSTGVNSLSSRSHAVMQFELRSESDERCGRLIFIDLAGSERASDIIDKDKQTRVEGAEINQSLLALKECIRSIDHDKNHTPYRQSKLTHILKESFEGNAKTCMIANVSPALSACDNTINTLQYAHRVMDMHRSNEVRKQQQMTLSNKLEKDKPMIVNEIIKLEDISNINDDVNSIEKSVKSMLFHPTTIQCSSTPKNKKHKQNFEQCEEFLIHCDDSPISGHKINKHGRRSSRNQTVSTNRSSRSKSAEQKKVFVTNSNPLSARSCPESVFENVKDLDIKDKCNSDSEIFTDVHQLKEKRSVMTEHKLIMNHLDNVIDKAKKTLSDSRERRSKTEEVKDLLVNGSYEDKNNVDLKPCLNSAKSSNSSNSLTEKSVHFDEDDVPDMSNVIEKDKENNCNSVLNNKKSSMDTDFLFSDKIKTDAKFTNTNNVNKSNDNSARLETQFVPIESHSPSPTRSHTLNAPKPIIAEEALQNQLISAHEEELCSITSVSKREMNILVALRMGDMTFTDYYKHLKELLELKSECISALRQRLIFD